MNTEELKSLLGQEEGVALEFKGSVDLNSKRGKIKFIKEMLSLVNSPDSPAYLVIGIEDKTKRFVGIKDLTEEQLQQVIDDNCIPPIRFLFRIIPIDDVEVGLITIPHSNRKPHTVKKKLGYSDTNGKHIEISEKQVFIRRGSVINEASVDEIIDMAQEDKDEENYNEHFLDQLEDIRASLNVISEHSYYWAGSRKKTVTVDNINLHPIANELDFIARALWPTKPNRLIAGTAWGILAGFFVGGLVGLNLIINPIGGVIVGLIISLIISGFGIIKHRTIQVIILGGLVGAFVSYGIIVDPLNYTSMISKYFSEGILSSFIVGALVGGIGGLIVSGIFELIALIGEIYWDWHQNKVVVVPNPYKDK